MRYNQVDKAGIESAIIAAVSACANDSGWANLAEIGAQLRKNGVNYGKLSKFFNDYQHLVETKVDEEISPPVVYAKIIIT